MSNNYTIQILPEAEEFFEYLADNLFREGYKNSYAFASKMVDEILDFVYEIPNVQHHSIPNEFLYHLKDMETTYSMPVSDANRLPKQHGMYFLNKETISYW